MQITMCCQIRSYNTTYQRYRVTVESKAHDRDDMNDLQS